MVQSGNMSHPILILIVVVAFCGWCLFVDADNASMGTNNLFLAICRVVARHVKLVFKLVFAMMVGLVAIWSLFEIGQLVSSKPSGGSQGGPETEQFFHFMNEATWPVQMILDGFTTLLGVFAAVALIFFTEFCRWYLVHARACNFALLGFYLIWLAYNVWKIVDEVYMNRGSAILCTSLALALWIGAEIAVVVHLWPVLMQFHQVVAANIYSNLH